MSWNQILNHDAALDRFARSIDRNRLASTYLFVGPQGIGKHTFALKLAETLLCESPTDDRFEPCGTCQGCLQVQAKTHPDLILVARPEDKAFIPVEFFIGDKEHRRQQGLCHDIGLKPFRGGRKVAIIDDADYLNQEGANSLLKTLEEPPAHSLLLLIGTSEQRQLSTIVSRSQVIRFSPLTNAQVLQIIQREGMIEDSEVPLPALAAASEGSVHRALELSNPETMEFRNVLFGRLVSLDPGMDDFVKTVTSFVDAAGKESAKKRTRLVMVGDLAISFYRQWMLQLAGVEQDPDQVDPSVAKIVQTGIDRWQNDINHGAEIAAQCIARCTQMQRQVVSNASAATVIDAWLRDIGRVCRYELIAYR